MRGFVVVSGLPASGKSTLASALGTQLNARSVDKDDFLERLFDDNINEDHVDRTRLSRIADAQFQEYALSLDFAVLSSWWRHSKSVAASGTPFSWIETSGFPFVEIHCKCPVELAVARFQQRVRHPGHLDSLRTKDELFLQFEETNSLGPLIPEKAIIFKTEFASHPDQIIVLAQRASAMLADMQR